MTESSSSVLIDGLQYSLWSDEIFEQMREGGLDAVHATVCYHENFRETVDNLIDWNNRFEKYSHLIMPGRTASDVHKAKQSRRTAIFFGLQNCSPIEDNIGLLEILHSLGVRIMQLSYNNQSLLSSGCYETFDGGVTRMGLEAIKEMNRLGIAIDMSHSGERSTLDAIRLSERPITVSHSNPASWYDVPRNKSDRVVDALAESGGMMGLSLYPHHLKAGSDCSLESFCEMVARLSERIGCDHIGIGSDLCQNQPDRVVEWMRYGRWMQNTAVREPVVFPKQPSWFRDNRDFPRLRAGLAGVGFAKQEIEAILGNNWLRFYSESFGFADARRDEGDQPAASFATMQDGTKQPLVEISTT